MRIVLAHTFYKQPGGEDRVFAAESALLREFGHDVIEYREHNEQMDGLGPASALARTVWNRGSHRRIAEIVRRERPDICHFHNTFPAMSPAVFHAAKAQGVPVVATLHNYRLLCPSATFLRKGTVCESCRSKRLAWPAAAHGCYRNSRAASAATAVMLAAHRAAGTWSRSVDVYIALTEFARQKFVSGGLPAERVVVKPNFVAPDPGLSEERGDFALFVGRLSAEKGVATLLAAWKRLKAPVRLRIAGDGPLAGEVRGAAAEDRRIEWLGAVGPERVVELMKGARALVFPSVWYEGLPLTVLEAYATGLAVIASDIGSLVELVEPDATGVRFAPGDWEALAECVEGSWSNREKWAGMGRRARQRYEEMITAAANYRRLMEVYEVAQRRAAAATERSESDRPARNCTSGSRWLWQRSKGRLL